MSTSPTLLSAEFDPKVKTYWFVGTSLGMLLSVVGIPFLFFWLLGWGAWFVRASLARMSCTLTERSLIIRKGIFFRVEKTLPLDKIQDLAIRQGPLMRHFGIQGLRVETAGQSMPQGASEADMVGIMDAREFRNRVLTQRDLLTGGQAPPPVVTPAAASAHGHMVHGDGQTLVEIRDSLRRIEGLLEQDSHRS